MKPNPVSLSKEQSDCIEGHGVETMTTLRYVGSNQPLGVFGVSVSPSPTASSAYSLQPSFPYQ